MLKTKIIFIIQILTGIPVLVNSISSANYLLDFIKNPNRAVAVSDYDISLLSILINFLERYANIFLILFVVFIVFGLIINHQAKKQEGKKILSLKKMNSASISVLSLWLIVWFLWFLLETVSPIEHTAAGKPVIYLYPKETTSVLVNLKFQGIITDTYPTINSDKTWNVIAHPDGTLINIPENKEYSYIFWEGVFSNNISLPNKGFVVAGKNTKDFLQEILSQIGLTPKEYNEFIVYWLPKMQHNQYNHIYFATSDYTDKAILDVTPKPDSALRVFMMFKALNTPISVEPQNFTPFTRIGFTLVEWGGNEVKESSANPKI